MKLTNVERETIILFNEGEKIAEIYTFNKKLIRKIKNANKKYPEIFKIKREDENGAITCEFPKDRLSVNLKLPPTKERSERQSNRMKAMHQVGAFKP